MSYLDQMITTPEPLPISAENTATVTDIQQLANDQLAQIRQIYNIQPKQVLENYFFEVNTTNEYNGRQLLELIQNADDAAHGTKHAHMLIALEDDRLIVANTGEPFSADGMDSIFSGHLSSKYNQKNQIGNKGLGFRSILNWSSRVTIKSGKLQVAFSETFSHQVFNELLEGPKGPELRTRVIKRFQRLFPAISVLRVPEVLDHIDLPESYAAFDTVIIIDLKPDLTGPIKAQLSERVNAEMMLFLNHLEKVSIRVPGHDRDYRRKISAEESLGGGHYLKTVALYDSGVAKPQQWTLYGKRGQLNDKNYELTVAFQDRSKETTGVLYSFFQTSVTFKFPGLLHGTFELTDNRNELSQRSDYNKLLFAESAGLIAGAAGQLARRLSGPADYQPLRLSMVDIASLHSLVKDSGFESKLKEALRKLHVFPSINGQYLDWSKMPGYYDEPEFARYLPKEEYNLLLVHAEDPAIQTLIAGFGPGKFGLDDVISSLADLRKQIPVADYARLAFALQAYAKTEHLNAAFLYDAHHVLLDPAKSVFIPTDNKGYQLPAGVGAQILDEALSRELKQYAGTIADAVIVDQLAVFRLQEFNFNKIVAALIDHFLAQRSDAKSLQEVHGHIFRFFIKEPAPVAQWAGRPIPVLNRKAKTTFANLVYYGKDQENALAETLYHYDPRKLIAPPERFGLPAGPQWKSYLLWMGVAALPRHKQLGPEKNFKAYGDYAMRRFSFRNLVGNRHFKNFKEFALTLDHYTEYSVLTIDGLEELLINNAPEDILAWLDADPVLMDLLGHDRETKHSYLSMKLGRGNDRDIYGDRMPSYLRWRISQIAWLPAESGETTMPDRCTTAASITAEFSPLIERPKLDALQLRRRGIERIRSEELLYACGVHRTVNTFSTPMLYGMLLGLRKADDSGKKARAIYNQLAQNYDESSLQNIDLTDPVREQYLQTGEVFCRDGSWTPHSRAFYVNDKHLGESMTAQFATIQIDRRRGKDKIRQLFRVAPLENVQIELVQKTDVSTELQQLFARDIGHFKPFVYALRQDADKGTERETISQVKIWLVSQLTVHLVKDTVDKVIDLADYEFLIQDRQTDVHLKIPASTTTLEELKDDIPFCSAIAEIFSALIDVETQRQQIRELYSRTPGGREEILRTELDDPQLQKLTAARTALNVVIDVKFEFWRNFNRCLSRKELRASGSDEALLAELCKKFAKQQELIRRIFTALDYNDLSGEASCALLLALLQHAGITLAAFNLYCYPPVSPMALYQAQFRAAKEGQRSGYRERYYQHCLNNPALRKSFRRVSARYYELVVPAEVTEPFEAPQCLQTFAADLFGDLPEADNAQPTADEQYLNAKNRLTELAAEEAIQRTLIDSFLEHEPEVDSLLFFHDEVEKVLGLLLQWSQPTPGTGTGGAGTKRRRVQFNGQPVFYDDLFDLRQQLDLQLPEIDIAGIPIKDITIARTPVNKSEPGEKKFKRGGRSPAQNEEIGFLGEYLVYHYLRQTVRDLESVLWISKYAKECGLASEDGNGAGFDMEYRSDEDGEPRYVEVKVLGYDDAFYISSTEVRFGEVNKKRHELFLVRNLQDLSKVHIERIVGLFSYAPGKSFNENDRFTVLNDNFILKFRKKEK